MVIVTAIILALMFSIVYYENQKPIRHERKAASDSNLYMKRIVTEANRIRNLKLFERDDIIIPGVSFDGSLGVSPTGGNYIDGIEAAMRDTRRYPTNPVNLYTQGILAGSPVDQFLLGAINAYRIKQVHVMHLDYSPDNGKVVIIYDSADDGGYTSHMLAEDVKRLLGPSPINW